MTCTTYAEMRGIAFTMSTLPTFRTVFDTITIVMIRVSTFPVFSPEVDFSSGQFSYVANRLTWFVDLYTDHAQ